MDLGSLRDLVLELNFSAHGIAMTVTRPLPDNTPIVTRGIWLTPLTEDGPVGTDLARREPRRVVALRRADVSAVPRGTLILAPEKSGDADRTWKVEGPERLEADHGRYLVVQVPEL